MKTRLFASLLTTTLLIACAHTPTAKERNQAKIHYDLGVTELRRNDSRAALRELLASAKLDERSPLVHNVLGLVYISMGAPEDAERHLLRAIALHPYFSEAYNNLGASYLSAGRYQEAIESFETVLKDRLYATPALAEGNLGWAYYKMGQLGTAVAHLNNALATNAKFCRGYEWLMHIELEQDNAASAVKHYQRFDKYCLQDDTIAPQIGPDYHDKMRYYYALGLLKLARMKEAKEVFLKCAAGVTERPEGFAAHCKESLTALQ